MAHLSRILMAVTTLALLQGGHLSARLGAQVNLQAAFGGTQKASQSASFTEHEYRTRRSIDSSAEVSNGVHRVTAVRGRTAFIEIFSKVKFAGQVPFAYELASYDEPNGTNRSPTTGPLTILDRGLILIGGQGPELFQLNVSSTAPVGTYRARFTIFQCAIIGGCSAGKSAVDQFQTDIEVLGASDDVHPFPLAVIMPPQGPVQSGQQQKVTVFLENLGLGDSINTLNPNQPSPSTGVTLHLEGGVFLPPSSAEQGDFDSAILLNEDRDPSKPVSIIELSETVLRCCKFQTLRADVPFVVTGAPGTNLKIRVAAYASDSDEIIFNGQRARRENLIVRTSVPPGTASGTITSDQSLNWPFNGEEGGTPGFDDLVKSLPPDTTIAIVAAPLPAVSISDADVFEGNCPLSVSCTMVSANFTVTLSTASTQPVTVHFETADGTALSTSVAGDYEATNGDLTFSPNETSKPITVRINGDTVDEPDETFFVKLSVPVNATIIDNQGKGTIQDDDEPLPAISISDATTFEGNCPLSVSCTVVSASFTVTLSRASTQPVKVHFETADGTALSTSVAGDYEATNGDLTFSPNETSKPITVRINGDTVDEPDETFFVNLSGPINATVADGQGRGTIVDDDLPPQPDMRFSPSEPLDFGSVPVFILSPPRTVTITNTGQGNLVISSATTVAIGTMTNNFSIPSGGDLCSNRSVAPNGTCTVSIVFTPTSDGTRGATLSVASNASGSPHSYALNGVGLTSVISLSPNPVDFGSIPLGSSDTKTVTLTNTGQAPLTGVAFLPQAASDFTKTSDNCTGVTVAVNATCIVTIRFAPTAEGLRTHTFQITSNGTSGFSFLDARGFGTTTPGVTLESLTFSPTRVTGGGGAIGTVRLTGPAPIGGVVVLLEPQNAALMTSPSVTISEGLLSQSFAVITTPVTAVTQAVLRATFAGVTREAMLTIDPNISPRTLRVDKAGLGSGTVVSSVGGINCGPNCATQTITLNAGTPVTLTASTSTGSPSVFGGWSVSGCIGTAACTVTLNSNMVVTATFNEPRLSRATTLAFSPQLAGTTSGSQVVQVTNTGTAPLNITGVAKSGTNSAEFAHINSCAAGIAPGANCTIQVTFSPTAAGTRTATLSITSNAPGSPHTVTLTGTGTSLEWPTQPPPPVTVLNGSTAPFNIQLTPQGGFSGTVSFTCSWITVSGQPPLGAACVSPAPITLSAPTNVTVNVTTTRRSLVPPIGMRVVPPMPVPVIVLLVALGLALAASKRPTRPRFAGNEWRFARLAFGLILLLTATLAGCGGGGSSSVITPPPPPPPGPGTPAGSYNLQVTASTSVGNQTISRTTPLSLIVQ